MGQANSKRSSMIRNRTAFLRAAIALTVAAAGGLMAWHLDRIETAGGQEFANALVHERGAMRLSALNFDGDVATMEFIVPRGVDAEVASEAYILQLGEDIRRIYCSTIAEGGSSLDATLLHVNVRAVGGGSSLHLLSRSLSRRACA